MTKTVQQQKISHSKFWIFIKDIPGYMEAYKQDIKCSLVYQWSDGKTTSLSELYARYPNDYANMMVELHTISLSRQKQLKKPLEIHDWRRRVIAVISAHLDEQGRTFDSKEQKLAYIMAMAVRIAGVGHETERINTRFNRISTTKLTAIYNAFLTKNKITKKVMEL